MVKRLKPPTAQELAEHARALAQAFQIALVENNELCQKPEDAVAMHLQIVPGTMFHGCSVQVIVDETSYAIALHELGHCIHPLGNDGSLSAMLKEESAWEWAEHHALIWSTAMQQVKQFSLDSYGQQAKRLAEQNIINEREAGKVQAAAAEWAKKIGVR